MKKRNRIVLIVALMFLSGGLATWILRSRERREPVYQGKTLSVWLNDLNRSFRYPVLSDPAAEAVRQIGTNALPFLLERARSKDSRFRGKLQEWFTNQSVIPVNRFHFAVAPYRHAEARWGFQALGPGAKTAIPELVELIKDEETADASADYALGCIGSEAVLPLTNALTNDNPAVRYGASKALGMIGSEAKAAVPNLIKCLRDRDHRMRFLAALALGNIAKEPAVSVPALIARLEDTDVGVRERSAIALGKFGDQANSAIPALLKAHQTQHQNLRRLAAEALKKIDPEAAEKVDLK